MVYISSTMLSILKCCQSRHLPSVVGLFIGCIVLLIGGCGGAPSHPNVVLITVDTLRADHTSVYGYHRSTTPFLEQVAANGVRAEYAYAPMPTTLPVHVSLFTSEDPIAHGVVRNGQIVSDRQVLLSEVLRGHGYRTAAFVSSYPLHHTFGLSRGFETYDDDFGGADSSIGTTRRWVGTPGEGVRSSVSFDRRANETTDRVFEWLEMNVDSEEPIFAWVHYFDPHDPFDPPLPWRNKYLLPKWKRGETRRLQALYDGEVAFTDSEIAKLVGQLDELIPEEETLLIVTADHGEALGEHGFVGHGPILYEGAVRIPLLFRWTGHLPRDRTVLEPIGLIDLAPTILGLIGLPSEARALQGRDLSAFVTEPDSHIPERPLFLQRRSYRPQRVLSVGKEGSAVGRGLLVRGSKYAVLRFPWKLIVAAEEGTRELYNIAEDPEEQFNAIHGHRDTARTLQGLLKSWIDAQEERIVPSVTEGTEEQLDRLRTLGYVR